MIPFLAKVFRGLSLALGATPPPPGKRERSYVLIWIGVFIFMIAFGVCVLLVVLRTVS